MLERIWRNWNSYRFLVEIWNRTAVLEKLCNYSKKKLNTDISNGILFNGKEGFTQKGCSKSSWIYGKLNIFQDFYIKINSAFNPIFVSGWKYHGTCYTQKHDALLRSRQVKITCLSPHVQERSRNTACREARSKASAVRVRADCEKEPLECGKSSNRECAGACAIHSAY